MGWLSLLCGVADSVVEPLLLFALGIGQVEHQRIEKVGGADRQAAVADLADHRRRHFERPRQRRVILQVEPLDQRVEQVGVANEQTEIMVGAGSLLGELAAGGVGQVVGLSDAHFLFGLIWSTGVEGCSREQGGSHFIRHGFYICVCVLCVR